MNTALVKSTVAASSGFFASITSFFYGYANLSMLAFFGAFVLTLAIQYNVLKIKIIIPIAAGLGFLYYFLNSFGININDIFNTLGFQI